jgi:nucleoside-diphosphate-sugar epimerase
MRVASLRLHWSIPNRSAATEAKLSDSVEGLWGYVQQDAAADAFLLALEDSDKWSGHEAFFITAPEMAFGEDSKGLRELYYPDVPVKEDYDVSGRKGFFDCSKAEQLLGWVHKEE